MNIGENVVIEIYRFDETEYSLCVFERTSESSWYGYKSYGDVTDPRSIHVNIVNDSSIDKVRCQMQITTSTYGTSNWNGCTISLENISPEHLYRLFDAACQHTDIARHFKCAQTYLDAFIPTGPTNDIQ